MLKKVYMTPYYGCYIMEYAIYMIPYWARKSWAL